MSTLDNPIATPRAPHSPDGNVGRERRRLGRLNPEMKDWKGRRVWLVGASSGIGRALAHALYVAGADVALSARNAGALEAFVTDHPRALAVPMDVVDADSVQAAARVVLAGGRIDCVVYCAAHYRELRATEFDLAEMLRHQQVNYVGALHVLDAVLPALLAQGAGHLSFMASVAGYRGLPKGLAYGPTKAALIHLSQTLYLDLHARNIGVSVVNPGFVQTRLTATNDFEMPALISVERAAHEILQGWARGRFEIHFPLRFTRVMKLLRVLPFGLYQALVRRITGL